MEEIYVNVEQIKPVTSKPSTDQRGPRSSERRCFGCAVLCLGLLSVLLLLGLIVIGFKYGDSEANLSELLQASNHKLLSVSEERDLLNNSLAERTEELNRLQMLSKQNGDFKANLSELLQASNHKLLFVSEERDLLNNSLAERTEELNRLQMLSKQKKTCPAGWKMFRCSCYLFSTQSGSWEEGRENCRQSGADLVIIDTFEEQEFLSKTIKKDSWIGLNDKEIEGTWKWIDDTALTLSYWSGGQPDNGGGYPQFGEEDCVHFTTAWKTEENWNDLNCARSLQWICEKMP